MTKTVKGKRYTDGKVQGIVIDPRTGRRILGSVPKGHAVLQDDTGRVFTRSKKVLKIMYPKLRG